VQVLLESMSATNGVFSASEFRARYITFMTTPGSHNDAYASTCHRMFFANLKHKGLAPEKCPDNDSHNVDTIDGILPVIATALANLQSDRATQVATASECMAVTRRSQQLPKYGAIFSDCLTSVASNQDDLNSAVSPSCPF
jgi:hypothetical protein